MKFEALASSSHGNAYAVSDRDTRILLECGLSYTKLQKLSGFSLSQCQGCLVSHEHKDHARAASELVRRGMTVYMSQGTAEALELDGVELIRSMEQFSVGSLEIVPFATFHDAREPLGFLIQSRTDGDVLAFATDTVNLRYRFPGLNILAIEANYAKESLDRCQKMPEKVRRRISNSHMEINTLCQYLEELELPRLREVYLLHLSDSNSRAWEFINKVTRAVPAGVKVTVCER